MASGYSGYRSSVVCLLPAPDYGHNYSHVRSLLKMVMYVCINMYVYLHARMSVCACFICLHACVPDSVCVCVCVCLCIYIYIYIYYTMCRTYVPDLK